MARVSKLFKPLDPPLFGCFWMPHFSLWAALQNANADDLAATASQSVAVQKFGRVIAACEECQRRGVQVGWTAARTSSFLPDCRLLPFNAAHEESAWQRVLVALYELTPKVESSRPGFAWCEARFSTVSARADSQKKQWLQLVREFNARLGLSHDRPTASLAAFSSCELRPIQRIAAGREAGFVAALPLETLEIGGVSGETIRRLRWFGVHHIGHLKGWTLPHLQSQFPDAKTLWRFVEAGSVRADHRAVTTWRPPPTMSQRFVFEQPATDVNQWESALEETLRVLESELGGRAGLHFCVTIEIRGKGKRQAARTLREAMGSAKRLREPALSLCVALLGEGDEIEALEVRLGMLRDEWWQDSLFETQSKRTRALKEALRQLETRLPGAVRKLQARDVFSPLSDECFELVPLDVEMMATAPALDQVWMLRGETPRLANNRLTKDRMAKDRVLEPKRKTRKRQVA